jgi:penicillin amidase
METLDPVNHPGRYLYNHQWLPLQTHQEIIRSRDTTKPFMITVSATIHGPILNSVVSDLKAYRPISLKWTLLQPEYTLTGFFQLDFATNWSQFLEALKNISISQNFIYADVSGNIGYHMSGLLPIRPANNDLLPVDGSTSAYEWRGYVPQKNMPTLFNPPSHVIVTANNQIVPANYPFYVTTYWDQGYRAQRINNLLAMTSRLTIADDQRIQADVYSIPAEQLTPFFIEAGRSSSGEAAAAAKLLQGWNYVMTRDSVAASVYEVTVSTLLRETLEPLLGKHLYTIYALNYLNSGLFTLLINLLTKPAAPFFGITAGSNANLMRDTAIAHALADSMNQLQTKPGSDPSQWSWGKLHQAHFNHPLASTWPLNFIFGVASLERPGDTMTVNVGGDDNFSADPPNYDQHTVSSLREIIDLSNLDNSLWIITTGESGQPFSTHYNDLIPLWDQNHYQSMGFSSRAEKEASREVLILQPSQSIHQ